MKLTIEQLKFAREGAPDEEVQCPCCMKPYTDWNTTEFIGWHGECVGCFFKREESNGK